MNRYELSSLKKYARTVVHLGSRKGGGGETKTKGGNSTVTH